MLVYHLYTAKLALLLLTKSFTLSKNKIHVDLGKFSRKTKAKVKHNSPILEIIYLHYSETQARYNVIKYIGRCHTPYYYSDYFISLSNRCISLAKNYINTHVKRKLLMMN